MNRFKINLSLILALLVAGFYACQHEPIEIADSNQDVFIKNAAVYGTQSTPESDGGIAPYIIPGNTREVTAPALKYPQHLDSHLILAQETFRETPG
jgi:hypothetical protein